MSVPATVWRRPTLGAQEVHPRIVHELVRRLKSGHVGPHHGIHAVHLRLRALVDGEHHFIHVLLVRILLLLLVLLLLLLMMMLLLLLLLHLAAAAVVVTVVIAARMARRHVVAIGGCTAHGWHGGIRAGRCLWERRRHMIQVTPAKFGDHAVAPLCACVEGC